MALSLVETMSDKWEPEKYQDEYREGLLKAIDDLVQSGGKAPSAAPKPRTESKNVIDLVDLLQKSLGSVEKTRKQKPAPKQKTQHRKAA